MAITVPFDDIVFAWNNYLKSIHRAYLDLGTRPVWYGVWPNWRAYLTEAALRDYSITVLNDHGTKLELYQSSDIGSLVFNNDSELTRFLLTFADPADQGRLCQF